MKTAQKILQICEDFTPSKYVGMMLDSGQASKIFSEVERRLGPTDLEPCDRYHTTIIYATKPIKTEVATRSQYSAIHKGFALFGDNNDILVMLLESPSLAQDNQLVQAVTGAVPTYIEYKPHLTLKYNATSSDLLLMMDYQFPEVMRYHTQDVGQNS